LASMPPSLLDGEDPALLLPQATARDAPKMTTMRTEAAPSNGRSEHVSPREQARAAHRVLRTKRNCTPNYRLPLAGCVLVRPLPRFALTAVVPARSAALLGRRFPLFGPSADVRTSWATFFLPKPPSLVVPAIVLVARRSFHLDRPPVLFEQPPILLEFPSFFPTHRSPVRRPCRVIARPSGIDGRFVEMNRLLCEMKLGFLRKDDGCPRSKGVSKNPSIVFARKMDASKRSMDASSRSSIGSSR
jgi:hypothetical protein